MADITQISPSKLADLLADQRPQAYGEGITAIEMRRAEPIVLIDVREPWEHELCHIEGSKLIPLSTLRNAIEELDPTAPTVLICHHGMRSMQAAFVLRSLGFESLINLQGGIDSWANAVDTSMARY